MARSATSKRSVSTGSASLRADAARRAVSTGPQLGPQEGGVAAVQGASAVMPGASAVLPTRCLIARRSSHAYRLTLSRLLAAGVLRGNAIGGGCGSAVFVPAEMQRVAVGPTPSAPWLSHDCQRSRLSLPINWFISNGPGLYPTERDRIDDLQRRRLRRLPSSEYGFPLSVCWATTPRVPNAQTVRDSAAALGLNEPWDFALMSLGLRFKALPSEEWLKSPSTTRSIGASAPRKRAPLPTVRQTNNPRKRCFGLPRIMRNWRNVPNGG